MSYSYKSYKTDGLLKALQNAVDTALRHHENIQQEAHAEHSAVYEAYPYRDEDGRPEWHFSKNEKNALLQVKWPPLFAKFWPPLRNQVIVSGIEITAEKNMARAGLWPLIKHLFKVYAWKRYPKDESVYEDVFARRSHDYNQALEAWHKLQASSESALSWNLSKINQYINLLREQPNKTIWLTGEEHKALQDTISKKHLDDIAINLGGILFTQEIRAGQIWAVEFKQASAALFAPFKKLEPVDNAALLNQVKDTLRQIDMGAFLLDFAEKHGISIQLQRYQNGYTRADHDPSAFANLKEKKVVLIDDPNKTLGTHAVELAHELRHQWQRITFADFFEKNSSDMDRVLKTRLIETDAHAVHIGVAFELNDKGIQSIYWEGFVCNELLDYIQTAKLDAQQTHADTLNVIREFAFVDFVGPGVLDAYERIHAETIAQLHQQGRWEEMVVASLYSSAKFLRNLAVTEDGISYIRPENVSLIQRELGQTGKSEYAKPVRPISGVAADEFSLA